MVILKEITTSIYVDNEDPVVVELGGCEETSLQNAFDTFKCLGFDAKDILKIESTEYPRHILLQSWHRKALTTMN